MFYLFSSMIIISAFGLILFRNPVHSVLALIMMFLNVAALLIHFGAEFIGLMLILVYVGAIAVLFLFTVMMMNISELKSRLVSRWYIVFALIALIAVEFYYAIQLSSDMNLSQASEITIQNIGQVLYTDYFIIFQIAGLILFVAMIGAIVLVHIPEKRRRVQNVSAQIARKKEDSFERVKVESNSGIDY